MYGKREYSSDYQMFTKCMLVPGCSGLGHTVYYTCRVEALNWTFLATSMYIDLSFLLWFLFLVLIVQSGCLDMTIPSDMARRIDR